jgi:hypothetical protein
MSYLRKSKSDTALVALNFSDQQQTITLDSAKVGASSARVLAATNPRIKTLDISKIVLEPYAVVIAEIQKQ